MALSDTAVSSLATALLDVIALIDAGVEAKQIYDQLHIMIEAGSTDAEITAYIKSLRDEAVDAL